MTLGVTRSPWLPNQQDNNTREGTENNPKTIEQPKNWATLRLLTDAVEIGLQFLDFENARHDFKIAQIPRLHNIT